jgi:hypothetical protein
VDIAAGDADGANFQREVLSNRVQVAIVVRDADLS